MTWILFGATAAIIVVGGVFLARYGDVIGEKSGISNVLGSNLFNLLILGLDDVFYTRGPLLASVEGSHLVAVLAVVLMNGVFLIGLTQQVSRKRFRVAWDTAAIAVVYAGAVWLMYRMHG